MKQCNDPFAEKLDELGYKLLAYPKTSVSALHVYESLITNKLKRLFIQSDVKSTSGKVKDLFKETRGSIGITKGEGSNIQKRVTRKINSQLSLKIMANYIQKMLKNKQAKEEQKENISGSFSNTLSVVFKINEIESIDADEIRLRNWLADNQVQLRANHKELIEKGAYYIATSILKAKKITMTLERKEQGDAAANFSKVTDLSLADGKFSVSGSEGVNDNLIYEGDKGLIFAVKLVRLIFSPKGVLTIDNKQDYNRVLSNNPELVFFENTEDFIEIE